MKKHYVILQNVVTFRVDWRRLQDADYQLHLIASQNGLSQLSDIQKSCFTSISESDFTDQSLQTILKNLIEQHNVAVDDMSIVTNDEYSLGNAARLREAMGVEGARYENVEPFINKIVMKRKVSEAGVRIPKHIAFEPSEYAKDPDAYIDYLINTLNTTHIFAKQVDSAASEGAAELQSRDELAEWCKEHSNVSNFELDEYLEGELYHVDCLVSDGNVIDVEVCVYSIPNAEFLKGFPLGSRTMTSDEKEFDSLVNFNQQVLDALSPVPDGATHHEVFRTIQGEWVFLEIAARAPGGMVPQIYEKHTGANIEESHFRVQMGLPLTTLLPRNERHLVASWMWYPRLAGEVTSTKKNLDIESKHSIEYLVQPGDKLLSPESIRDRIAALLIWNEDQTQLAEDFEKSKNLRPVTVYPASSLKRNLTHETVLEEEEDNECTVSLKTTS